MSATHSTRDLAAAFDQLLREHMEADDYAAAIDANRADGDPNVCHTHEYTDANECMIAAFVTVYGRPSTMDDADTKAINAAWNLWRSETVEDADAFTPVTDDERSRGPRR